jgi:hypothetical protein
MRYVQPVVAAMVAALLISGCSGEPTASKKAAPDKSDQAQTTSSHDAAAKVVHGEEEHGHKPSAHGGILVAIGRDNYHAEAVFEKGGILRLYMLGQDESKVQEVESQTITAYVKAEGDSDATSVVFRSEPQPGDKAGMTSLFLVHLPKELTGKRLEVTIPSLRIGGDRFRLAFKSNPPGEGGEHGMPPKVADAEERKLYLTPGGKYTAADIKANGNVVASEKFKGFKAEHDLKPKVGDKICPVTLTKANPKCTWIVGGKTYEFCCPPCVDEFVALAKEKPEEIQDPEFYRKKAAGESK